MSQVHLFSGVPGLFEGRSMRKLNNWMVIAGLLLIVGGAVTIWATIRNNLPTPFDIASGSEQDENSLPIIAPANSGNGNDFESATQIGAPTVDSITSYTPAFTPEPQTVGMIPDRLVISKINLDAPIIPVSYKDIKVGDQVYYQWLAPEKYAAGWQDTSALLGLSGNTVLNGHHNAYGKVFQDLVSLNIGDDISIYAGAIEFRYQVVAKMLLPERFAPLSQRLDNARWIEPSKDERITLITCWPATSNTHRVVIVAFPIGAADANFIPTQPSQ
jgi:LPXTG-site transpeptidase (sortase) family protein